MLSLMKYLVDFDKNISEVFYEIINERILENLEVYDVSDLLNAINISAS